MFSSRYSMILVVLSLLFIFKVTLESYANSYGKVCCIRNHKSSRTPYQSDLLRKEDASGHLGHRWQISRSHLFNTSLNYSDSILFLLSLNKQWLISQLHSRCANSYFWNTVAFCTSGITFLTFSLLALRAHLYIFMMTNPAVPRMS
jgi:hypothetical protein